MVWQTLILTMKRRHTHTHTTAVSLSVALQPSLHRLLISVSCFLHACSRLFVCGLPLRGRPPVWGFLFSLDHSAGHAETSFASFLQHFLHYLLVEKSLLSYRWMRWLKCKIFNAIQEFMSFLCKQHMNKRNASRIRIQIFFLKIKLRIT